MSGLRLVGSGTDDQPPSSADELLDTARRVAERGPVSWILASLTSDEGTVIEWRGPDWVMIALLREVSSAVQRDVDEDDAE